MMAHSPSDVAVLSIQPSPISAHVAHMNDASAIARSWQPGDSRRCRLCPVCVARDNLCLIMINRFVADDEAALFSTRKVGARFVDAG